MAVIAKIGFLCNNTKLCVGISVAPILLKRTIMGKSLRESLQIPPRLKPFPYMEKDYQFWHTLYDFTTERFNHNTKLIVVDGPIASGKTELAKQLADEFDMKHFPEPTADDHYITDYGFDLRSLDPKLPKNCRSYDYKNFNQNPTHRHAARLQFMMYQLRYRQYLDALAHILNTGQGVILERSVYSDAVFADTMVDNQFMSKECRAIYQELTDNTLQFLLKPHLVIYLDMPVNVVKERVKQRNIDYEKDSKLINDTFLSSMERNYKQKYLKDISTHAELLVYDWSAVGDTDIIVEDIERINFDNYDDRDPKNKDWRLGNEADWTELRMNFTNLKVIYLNYLTCPGYAEELTISGEESVALNNVLEKTPGCRYDYGYNEDMGDTGILFKTKIIRKEIKANLL